MLSINTNLSSLIAQSSMKESTKLLNQAVERMTTGFKINHAKDNAANYSIATNMSTKINSYMVAEDNVAMGLDMVATASDSLNLISEHFQRLRDLATQASNDTYGEDSLRAINAEANARIDEIERLFNTTEYNGISISKGKVTQKEESKFIEEIDRRDTSKMTSLASIDETQKIESGTYSISSAEELAKFARMVDNALVTADAEFVLANNIDLETWCDTNGGWNPIAEGGSSYFIGTFDGNGYIISNLKIDTSSNNNGLFANIGGAAIIKNLGIEDANIKTTSNSGILSGAIGANSKIINCYVTGDLNGTSNVGGFCGYSNNVEIINSWSDVNIEGTNLLGGIIAGGNGNSIIKNCFTLGNINLKTSTGKAGGLTSHISANTIVDNCYAKGTVSGPGTIDDFIAIINGTIQNCNDEHSLKANAKINIFNSNISFQIGINSDETSSILLDIGYNVNNINLLRKIGLNNTNYNKQIDNILSTLREKQTELGAVSNRLESVLEEITIQRDNLVSSRSTIRDADIAEVSSQYIQQQILQEAAATLLATANQTPSIALGLI